MHDLTSRLGEAGADQSVRFAFPRLIRNGRRVDRRLHRPATGGRPSGTGPAAGDGVLGAPPRRRRARDTTGCCETSYKGARTPSIRAPSIQRRKDATRARISRDDRKALVEARDRPAQRGSSESARRRGPVRRDGSLRSMRIPTMIVARSSDWFYPQAFKRSSRSHHRTRRSGFVAQDT
jgi:hypothetical protein